MHDAWTQKNTDTVHNRGSQHVSPPTNTSKFNQEVQCDLLLDIYNYESIKKLYLFYQIRHRAVEQRMWKKESLNWCTGNLFEVGC